MATRKTVQSPRKSEATTPVEERPPEPRPPQQVVIRRCGHSEPLASVQSRDCAACKERRRGAKLPPDSYNHGRLPQGAAFFVTYDADKQRWSGALNVPGVKTFEGSASGVFYLLRQLDKQFRAWEAGRRV